MKIAKLIKYPKYLFRVIVVLLLILLIALLVIFILDYTITKHGLTSGLNLDRWDWLALIVAAFSLCITVLTWWSQDQTRENTTRLDTKDYRDILVSSYYNIVRNTINLYSLSAFMEDKYAAFYPSEEYLQKLKLYLFDVDQIPTQNIPKYYRSQFQRVAELCHYFNLHIDSAQKHLSSKPMSLDIKKRDIESLKAMHWLLAFEILKVLDFICPKDVEINRDLVRCKISKVVDHFRPKYNSSTSLKTYDHIGIDNVKFLYGLYEGVEGYDEILKNLNDTIHYHLVPDSNGKNKIPLIPFG